MNQDHSEQEGWLAERFSREVADASVLDLMMYTFAEQAMAFSMCVQQQEIPDPLKPILEAGANKAAEAAKAVAADMSLSLEKVLGQQKHLLLERKHWLGWVLFGTVLAVVGIVIISHAWPLLFATHAATAISFVAHGVTYSGVIPAGPAIGSVVMGMAGTAAGGLLSLGGARALYTGLTAPTAKERAEMASYAAWRRRQEDEYYLRMLR